MTDPGDIWQRYDAKVMQIQVIEARAAALEKEIAQVRDERDHWARICRDLGKKLSVARSLAERLRNADRVKAGRPETLRARRPAELQAGASAVDNTRYELDRAREVLGLVLTALTKALDDDEVVELGAKLRHHAGGKLLQSITRGSLNIVPVDGRYLVDRGWLQQLDLSGLRRELDVAAQSGIYNMPEDSAPNNEVSNVELEVDIDEDAEMVDDGLPPPPPLSLAGFGNSPPPPLLSALPEESDVMFTRPNTGPEHSASRPVAPDTVRSQSPSTFIPNLRVGRLIKNPGTT